MASSPASSCQNDLEGTKGYEDNVDKDTQTINGDAVSQGHAKTIVDKGTQTINGDAASQDTQTINGDDVVAAPVVQFINDFPGNPSQVFRPKHLPKVFEKPSNVSSQSEPSNRTWNLTSSFGHHCLPSALIEL